MREKFRYSKLFRSPFSRIWAKHGEILRISPYSVRMWENADQNKSEYGYFLRSYTNMNTPEMYLGPCQKTIMNKTIFARRLHASQMFDRVLNTSLVPFNQLSRYVLIIGRLVLLVLPRHLQNLLIMMIISSLLKYSLREGWRLLV